MTGHTTSAVLTSALSERSDLMSVPHVRARSALLSARRPSTLAYEVAPLLRVVSAPSPPLHRITTDLAWRSGSRAGLLLRRRARAVHGQFRADTFSGDSCCPVHGRQGLYVDRVTKSLEVAAVLEDGQAVPLAALVTG